MKKIKKIFLMVSMLLAGFSGFVLSGCEKSVYDKVEFDLSETELTLSKVGFTAGESKVINATITGAKGNVSKKIAFVSSNPEVAYVETTTYSDGTSSAKIVAVNGGRAIIYAIAEGNIRKTINVFVEQEAQSISANGSYNPLIVKGETFEIDSSKIVFSPSTVSNRNFTSKLYKLAEGATAITTEEPIATIDNANYLSIAQTSALEEGNYSIRVFKQTTNGTLTADFPVSVKTAINEGLIKLYDLDGNVIEGGFRLATNVNPDSGEDFTTAQFKISYGNLNDSGEYVSNFDTSKFTIEVEKNTNCFEIYKNLESSAMVYTIQSAFKTLEGESFKLKFSYAGFENFDNVEIEREVVIDTYPENIGYVLAGESQITELDTGVSENVLDIYSNEYTNLSFVNLPADTTYNGLVLEISSTNYSKLQSIKVNGENAVVQTVGSIKIISFNSGDVLGFKANVANIGESFALNVYNKDFATLSRTINLNIQKEVEVGEFFVQTATGIEKLSNSIDAIVGQNAYVYFTYNHTDNPYFEGFSALVSGSAFSLVSLDQTTSDIDLNEDGIIEESEQNVAVGRLTLFANQKGEATLNFKNGSVYIASPAVVIGGVSYQPIEYVSMRNLNVNTGFNIDETKSLLIKGQLGIYENNNYGEKSALFTIANPNDTGSSFSGIKYSITKARYYVSSYIFRIIHTLEICGQTITFEDEQYWGLSQDRIMLDYEFSFNGQTGEYSLDVVETKLGYVRFSHTYSNEINESNATNGWELSALSFSAIKYGNRIMNFQTYEDSVKIGDFVPVKNGTDYRFLNKVTTTLYHYGYYTNDFGNALKLSIDLNAVVPIQFEDVEKTIPSINLVNENLDTQINVSSLTKNENNNDVSSVKLNDLEQNGTVEKGEFSLFLKYLSADASIRCASPVVQVYNGENLALASSNDIIVEYVSNLNALNFAIKNDGWNKKYKVSFTIYYFDENCVEQSVTKVVVIDAYTKLKFNNISIEDNGVETNFVSLVDFRTSGENYQSSYKELTLNIAGVNENYLPNVFFTLGQGGNQTTFEIDGVEYTRIEGQKLTLVYKQNSSSQYTFYVLAKEIGDLTRYSEFIIATVSQDGSVYNKVVEIMVVKNSLSSELIVDDYIQNDLGENYYRLDVVEGRNTLQLNNTILPSYSTQGVGYEVLSGDYFTVSPTGLLTATGVGVNGIVRIYAKDSKNFVENNWLKFITGENETLVLNQPTKFVDVKVRVEDGSENAPFSILNIDDLLNRSVEDNGRYKIDRTSETQIYFDVLNNLDFVSANVVDMEMYSSYFSIINYAHFNGNGYYFVLDRIADQFNNSTIENLKITITDNLLFNAIENSSLSNLQIVSDGASVVDILNNSTIDNCLFTREIETIIDDYAGIANGITNNSVVSNNTIVLKLNSSREVSGRFAGVALDIYDSSVLNNSVKLYQYADGEEYAISGSASAKGGMIAVVADNATISENSVLSYKNDSINSGFESFAGLVETVDSSVLSKNSVMANMSGNAFVGTISDGVTIISDCNFVGNNGANGKIIGSTEEGSKLLVCNIVYYNAGAISSFSLLDGAGIEYYRNIYVLDNNEGSNTVTVGDSNLNKLTTAGFENKDNFYIYNADRNDYDGFAFYSGFNQTFDLEQNEDNEWVVEESKKYVNYKTWTIGDNDYPVLVKRVLGEDVKIDLNRALSLEISKTQNNPALKGTVLEGEIANSYLYLSNENVLGKEISVSDVLNIKIDEKLAQYGVDYEFNIASENFSKERQGRIKINSYGYAKITIYSLTNPSLSQEVVLFIYQNGTISVKNLSTNENIVNGAIIYLREGETLAFKTINETGFDVVVQNATEKGNGVYAVVGTNSNQTITISCGIVVDSISYTFSELTGLLNIGDFYVVSYSGATDVSFSFNDNTTISKQDSIVGVVSITTDKGVVENLAPYISISGLNLLEGEILPELSYEVLGSYSTTQTIAGVIYTTTYFDIKFFFENPRDLIDQDNSVNDEGVYTITVGVDEISATAQIILEAQEIQSINYEYFVSSNSDLTEDIVQSIQQRPLNYIVPQNSGMLDVYVYPYYADYDSVSITTNILQNQLGQSVGLAFEQRIYDAENRVYAPHSSTSINNGIMLRRDSSVITEGENSSLVFDGHYYVRCILGSEASLYLENNSIFVLTVSFYRNGVVVYTKNIELIVESVPKVEFDNADIYVVAGVQTALGITSSDSNIDFTLSVANNSFNVYNYVEKPNLFEGQYYLTVPYTIFEEEDFDGFITIRAITQKRINNFVHEFYDERTIKVMKFVVDSIYIPGETVYTSDQIININYKVNATYYNYRNDLYNVLEGGREFTEEVEAQIANLEADLNNFANLNEYANFQNQSNWDFYNVPVDENDYSIYNLKITSKIYNNNINFGTSFELDYGTQNYPTWPKDENSFYTQERTAMLSSFIQVNSDEEYPDPIYSEQELLAMSSEKHYRLMNNIKLSSWIPMDLEVLSFDGNGFVIYIDSFNLNLNSTNALNIGLFNTVSSSTLLKNVIVGYNNTTITVQNASEVNFGGIAAINYGTIYNCEVLGFDLINYEVGEGNIQNPTIPERTFEENAFIKNIVVNVSTTLAQETTVAGFVAKNEGNIINSRVGRTTDSIVYSSTNETNNAGVGYYGTGSATLAIFEEFVKWGNGLNITSSGVVSGFVGENNSATIASSYVANIGIKNLLTNTTYSLSAGFVAINGSNSEINGCFVYGQKDENDEVTYTKSLIWSSSHIGGFVYTNRGRIVDCLTNVKTLTNALSAGFAFNNSDGAEIVQCVSLSQNVKSLVNSPFVGHTGLVSNQNGVVDSCFYYDYQNIITNTAEDKSATAIRTKAELSISENYNGFAFANEGNRAVWQMVEANGFSYPALTSANEIAVSHFVLSEQDDEQKYSYIEESSNTNPILIATASQWQKRMLNKAIIVNGVYTITGSFRLIDDIDFSAYNNSEVSSLQTTYFYDFSGKLDGNGLSISKFALSTEQSAESVGLFGSINKVGAENVVVKNFNIGFDRSAGGSSQGATGTILAANVKAVGGLAGIINNAEIYKIDLTGDYAVSGGYFAGGLAGIIIGENTIVNNINNNLSAFISKPGTFATAFDFSNSNEIESIIDFDENSNKVSIKTNEATALKGFAGSVAGYVDIGYTGASYVEPQMANIQKIYARKVSRVAGTYAGGVFGYVGKGCYIHEVGFIANNFEESRFSNQHLIGYQVVGGVVGVNEGTVRYAFVEHQNQSELDSDLFNESLIEQESNNVNLNSEVNLFRIGIIDGNYNKNIYVGGVLGININQQLNDGSLMYGGIVKDSYNKVAVIPAYNTKTIGIKFDTEYDLNTLSVGFNGSVLNYDGFICYAGGLVGFAKGINLSTSYSTAQVVAQYSGGIIGKGSGNIVANWVNGLTQYVSGGVSIEKQTNGSVFYPSSLYTLNSSYYVLRIDNRVGAFASLLETDANVYLNDSQFNYVSTIDGLIDNSTEQDVIIPFVKVKGNNVELFNSSDDTFAFSNNIPQSMIADNGELIKLTSAQSIRNIETYFSEFSENSEADWITVDLRESKQLPYPNFGILTSVILTTAYEFEQVKTRTNIIYTVIPTASNYKIYLNNWHPSSLIDFTGSLIGIEQTDRNGNAIIDEDTGEKIYPTIVLTYSSLTELTSLFNVIRGANIRNINLVVRTNSSLNSVKEQYFGFLAKTAYNCSINNVDITFETIEEGVSPEINISEFTTFGTMFGYDSACLIENCSISVPGLVMKDASYYAVDDSDDITNFGGLVGEVKGGTIRNNNVIFTQSLSLDSPTLQNFGGIAGIARTIGSNYNILNNEVRLSSIDNSSVANSVLSNFGGIVGKTEEKVIINKCHAVILSNLKLTSNNTLNVGGIAGEGKGIIENSDTTFTSPSSLKLVNGTNVNFGGIAGRLESGNINKCEVQFGNGIVVSDGNNYIGGIAGNVLKATITNSWADLTISGAGSSSYFGGIAGSIEGNGSGISQCFANVNFDASDNTKGGIVGYVENVGSEKISILNCYSSGNIATTSDATNYVGGLVGESISGRIENCYSVCEIGTELTANTAKAGLVVGYALNSTINNVFSFRECNMELQGIALRSNALDASVMFISQFYQNSNNVAAIWQARNGFMTGIAKMPTLSGIGTMTTESFNALTHHASGSRLNPILIDFGTASGTASYQLSNNFGQNYILATEPNSSITKVTITSTGFKSWLISNITINKLFEFNNFNLDETGVISGLSLNQYTTQNNFTQSKGIITNCDFNSISITLNPIISTLECGYVEDVSIVVNAIQNYSNTIFVNNVGASVGAGEDYPIVKFKNISISGTPSVSGSVSLESVLIGNSSAELYLIDITTNVSTNAESSFIYSLTSGSCRMTKCYNTGKLSSTSYAIGGLIACVEDAELLMEFCFNMGTIKSTASENSGGLIREITESDKQVSIHYSYNAGFFDISAGVSGGLIGKFYSSTREVSISNSFSASMKKDLFSSGTLNGIIGNLQNATTNFVLNNVYYAQDLLFNDVNGIGSACDYAELKQIYNNDSYAMWGSSKALPFLKIGLFASATEETFASIASNNSLSGTLFAPNLVDRIQTSGSAVYYLTKDLIKVDLTHNYSLTQSLNASGFSGVMLGGNHKVETNYSIYSNSGLGDNATIIGLDIVFGKQNYNVVGGAVLTSFIGNNALYLNNIHAEVFGNLGSEVEFGGLIGGVSSSNNLVLWACSTTGTIKTNCSDSFEIGGLIGSAYSRVKINQCYSTLSIVSTNTNSDSKFGGIIGSATGLTNITDCYYAGVMKTDNSSSLIYGLAGYLTNTSGNVEIMYCYDASIYVVDSYTGEWRRNFSGSGIDEEDFSSDGCWSGDYYAFNISNNLFNDGSRLPNTTKWVKWDDSCLPTLSWQYALGAESDTSLIYKASQLDSGSLNNEEGYNQIGVIAVDGETVGALQTNYNGNGYYIKNSNSNSNGIFESIDGTSVCNLNALSNIESSDYYSIGAYAEFASNLASFENCISCGTISNTSSDNANAGGFVGAVNEDSEITFINCYNLTTIDSNASAGGFVGSINQVAHDAALTFEDCYNYGSCESLNNAGGYIGYININILTFIIRESFNFGFVSASNNAGGFIGFCEGNCNIESFNSSNKSNIVASEVNSKAGGFVGSANVSTLNIHEGENMGTIQAVSHAGGFAGYVNCSLDFYFSDGYENNGDINAYYAGGLIGMAELESTVEEAYIDECTNHGTITASYYAGGVFGSIHSQSNVDCSFEDLINESTITVNDTDGNIALSGGIAGLVHSKKISIEYAENNGTVSASSSLSEYSCFSGGIFGVVETYNMAISETCNSSDVSTISGFFCGGLIGYANNTFGGTESKIEISYCENSMKVGTSTANVQAAGGFVGYSLSTISNITINRCDNSATIGVLPGSVLDSQYAGGFVAECGGVIIASNSTNKGDIIGRITGGVAAKCLNVDLDNVSNEGHVFSDKEYTGLSVRSGGLIGEINNAGELFGEISNSTNKGMIGRSDGGSDWMNYGGGFVGYLGGTSFNIFGTNTNEGEIWSTKSGSISGGFVGYSSAAITIDGTNSNKEDIKADKAAGGFVGETNTDVTLSGTNTNIGDVFTYNFAGGFVGETSGLFSVSGLSTCGVEDGNPQTTIQGGEYVGGFIGHSVYFQIGSDTSESINYSTVLNSRVNNYGEIGGFVGLSDYEGSIYDEIINAKNYGAIGSNIALEAGGLIGGGNNVIVKNCVNEGRVVAQKLASGFIASVMNAKFEGVNKNEGTIESLDEGSSAGGFVGYASVSTYFGSSEEDIESNENINTGNVTGRKYAGGFVGFAYEIVFMYDTIICGSEGANPQTTITGGEYAGGFVGYCNDMQIDATATNYAIIINAYVGNDQFAGGFAGYVGNGSDSASFNGVLTNNGEVGTQNGFTDWAGGFVGYSFTLLSLSGVCTNNATIKAYWYGAGGFAGYSKGFYSYDTCENHAKIVEINSTSWNWHFSGGFVGVVDGHLKLGSDSKNVGSSVVGRVAGGLVGQLYIDQTYIEWYSASQVYSSAKIEGFIVGGIIGEIYNPDSITGNIISFNHSETDGELSADYSGGFIGKISSSITISFEDCGRQGDYQTIAEIYAGGFVGYTSSNISFKQCSNYSKITTNTGNVGGFVGGVDAGVTITFLENNINSGNVIVRSYGSSENGFGLAGGFVGGNEYNGFTIQLGNLIDPSTKVRFSLSTITIQGKYAGTIVGCRINALTGVVYSYNYATLTGTNTGNPRGND